MSCILVKVSPEWYYGLVKRTLELSNLPVMQPLKIECLIHPNPLAVISDDYRFDIFKFHPYLKKNPFCCERHKCLTLRRIAPASQRAWIKEALTE